MFGGVKLAILGGNTLVEYQDRLTARKRAGGCVASDRPCEGFNECGKR